MTLKGGLGIVGGVASAAAIIVAVWTLRHETKVDWNGEGATAQHLKECCDRVDKIEKSVSDHYIDAEGWKARVKENEDKDIWQDRRLDGHDSMLLDMKETLGRIEGTQAEILRRLPAASKSKISIGQGEAMRTQRTGP